MFLSKYLKTLGISLLVNPSGIYVQELVGARFSSKQVRIGKLILIDGTVQPHFDAWEEQSLLCDQRDLLEKQIKAKESLKGSAEVSQDTIESDLERLRNDLEAVRESISAHPVSTLIRINGQVVSELYGIIGKANFKHKLVENKDGTVSFTNYVTNAAFLEAQAKDLSKRFNEALEAQGIETGYMDIETARQIIAKRFNYGSTAKTTKGKAKAKG